MLQPKRTKYRKAFKGRISGAAKGGFNLDFGVVRPEGDGAGPPDRAPDRGRPPRHHASHEACRPRLDPDLPGRAGLEEACRSPHGLRQGRARVLGGPREAGPHPVRAGRRDAARSPRRRWRSPPPSCRSRPVSSPASAPRAREKSMKATIFAPRRRTSSRKSSAACARKHSTCVSRRPAVSSARPDACARCAATSPASRRCWARRPRVKES